MTSLFAIMEGKEWSSFENRTVSRPWPPWCLVCLYSILASSGTLQRRSAYLSPSNTDDRSANRVGREAYVMAYKRFPSSSPRTSYTIFAIVRRWNENNRIFSRKILCDGQDRELGTENWRLRDECEESIFNGFIFFGFWPSSNLIFLFTRTLPVA